MRVNPDPWKRLPRRRAFTMTEVVLSTFLLAVAMTTTVQVLGWVASERRAAERRQWALQEVANLMEHLSAEPWDQITPESARDATLGEEIRGKLPDPELTVVVDERDADRGVKRLAIRLRWRNRAGGWEAPVRLTSWIARRRSDR
jgi:hypothetical protein